MKKKRLVAWIVCIIWYVLDWLIWLPIQLIDNFFNHVDNLTIKLWYKWNP